LPPDAKASASRGDRKKGQKPSLEAQEVVAGTMTYVFIWWIVVEILGLAALPLAWRLFGNLPDRGYALAKPLGILLTSYLFWLAVSFGLLSNTRIAIILIILLVAGVSAVLYVRKAEPPGSGRDVSSPDVKASASASAMGRAFRLGKTRKLVIASELVFTVAFALWALVRAYNPEISATEKPMEFAFLNGILRSEHFPPLDPWLSGFAISYYYFGYVMMAMLTKLSGVPSEVAFNLGIALLFGLTASGAFSLTYNLVTGHGKRGEKGRGAATVFGALGAVFVAVVGNLEGMLEVLHTRGLGLDSFWEWVDVKNLASAPISGSWTPTDSWWWWRASRVVHDVVLGQDLEVIDEFPFFSFLLGDMHPHVLALPFVLLTLGLALNLLWSKREAHWWEMILLGLSVGGLGFLNSWDMPTYLLICLVAFALASYRRLEGFGRRWITEVGFFTLVLVTLSFLLYLPFYVGFRSQFGGIAPVLLVKTRLHQYAIMFGMFLYVAITFLGYGLWRMVRALRAEKPKGGGGRWLVLASVSAFILVLVAFFMVLKWHLVALLILLIGAGFLLLWERLRSSDLARLTSSSTFGLILTLGALLLTLSVEIVFLRDTFGTRMNTVFKFYYQAWVLFAISAAFGIYYLTSRAKGRWNLLSGMWLLGLLPLFLASLAYPLLATHTKTNGFADSPTLDGMAHLQQAYGDDLAAIRWLRANATGAPVILEATGGSYTYYGRISVHTGLPALLGWGGHELQWRGNYEEPGKREPDIEALYNSPDRELTSSLLDQYDISYVYVGGLERSTYQITPSILDKFGSLMDVVYQEGEVTIYQRRQ
jgi:YYY domain-containing protein